MHVADYASFYFCYQMNKDKPKSSKDTPTDTKDMKVGQLFPNASLDDYARQKNRVNEDLDDGEIHDSKHDDCDGEVCDDEDDNSSENKDSDEDNEDNEADVPDQMNAK